MASALGPFVGKLNNDGDEIVLRDSAAREINRLTYGLGFPWPLAGGDRDASIGLINAQLDNRMPGAWRSGWPTPGRANDGVTNNPPPLLDCDLPHALCAQILRHQSRFAPMWSMPTA